MDSLWEVIFYQTEEGQNPVQRFLDELPRKENEKLLRCINMLAEQGIMIRMPHSRSIENADYLFELRSQVGNNIQRVFYCHYQQKSFILLHGFTKKTQHTPSKEIRIAQARQQDWLKRNPSHD